jgi:hypothetical protein
MAVPTQSDSNMSNTVCGKKIKYLKSRRQSHQTAILICHLLYNNKFLILDPLLKDIILKPLINLRII